MQRLDLGAALLGQLDGGRDHLLADQAQLHRDEDAGELGLGKVLRRGFDPLEQPLAAATAHKPVDDEPGDEPDRAAVAGAGMGHQRNDEDPEGPRGADERGHGNLHAAQSDPHRSAEGALELRLGEAERDHGELGRGEGAEDAEAEQAREEADRIREERGHEQERDRDQRGGHDRFGRHERSPVEAAERTRELAVLAEGVREPCEPRNRGRDRDEQDEGSGEADVEAQCRREAARDVAVERGHDSHHRCVQPASPEGGCAVIGWERRQGHEADRDVDQDDEPDPGKEAARQVASRLARLLGEVRHRLEPRVGEHRQRQGEGDLVPGRLGADRDSARERVPREEQREAERHEAELRDEVEHGDDDPVAVEGRATEQADHSDADDHADRDDQVPGVPAEGGHLERGREVMRQKERRERDHDQVVEEERPAGEEAGEVVERPANEGRGAARLRDRRGALCVRERNDQEEGAHEREHLGGEPQRVQGDDPEGDVDRGGDLAVRDREERRGVEDALKAGDLARHKRRLILTTEEVEPPGAEPDEQHADHIADAAAVDRGLDDQCDPDSDRDHAEDGYEVPVWTHATFRAAATITRQGAFLST